MTSINYLRYVAYALFAIGLINLRYQSGESDLALRTLIIVGTGIVIFALTYIKAGQKLLANPAGKALSWLVAIAATLFAILN
jgi:amino acid transporter